MKKKKSLWRREDKTRCRTDFCGFDCWSIFNPFQRLINLEKRVAALESSTLTVRNFGTPGSYTFTFPLEVKNFAVSVYGGGGGGGFPTVPPLATNAFNIGGGGGAGGFVYALYEVTDPSSIYNIVVGNRGEGATSIGTNGNNGTTSVFSGLERGVLVTVAALGGQGGKGIPRTTGTTVIFDGGAGGSVGISTVRPGDLSLVGQSGQAGQSNVASSGAGGNGSPPLGGARGAAAVPGSGDPPLNSVPAQQGGIPGAGGGGGLTQTTTTGNGAIQFGAGGGSGLVRIEYSAPTVQGLRSLRSKKW